MTAQNVIAEMPDRDVEAIRDILEGWKADGNENPLLPMDVDIDGDGKTDAFGLDADGNVIVVSECDLDSTVYVSEGDDAILHEPEEA